MSQSSPGYVSKRDVQLEGRVELQVFVGVEWGGVGWCDIHRYMLWFLNVVWGCLIPQSRGWGLGRVQSVVVNCDSTDVCRSCLLSAPKCL